MQCSIMYIIISSSLFWFFFIILFFLYLHHKLNVPYAQINNILTKHPSTKSPSDTETNPEFPTTILQDDGKDVFLCAYNQNHHDVVRYTGEQEEYLNIGKQHDIQLVTFNDLYVFLETRYNYFIINQKNAHLLKFDKYKTFVTLIGDRQYASIINLQDACGINITVYNESIKSLDVKVPICDVFINLPSHVHIHNNKCVMVLNETLIVTIDLFMPSLCFKYHIDDLHFIARVKKIFFLNEEIYLIKQLNTEYLVFSWNQGEITQKEVNTLPYIPKLIKHYKNTFLICTNEQIHLYHTNSRTFQQIFTIYSDIILDFAYNPSFLVISTSKKKIIKTML